MNDTLPRVRCQRCGEQMDLKDPAEGMAWQPEQYWVCPRCGRHFWSTYPAPGGKDKPAAA
jgi:ribosomal protein L37E